MILNFIIFFSTWFSGVFLALNFVAFSLSEILDEQIFVELCLTWKYCSIHFFFSMYNMFSSTPLLRYMAAVCIYQDYRRFFSHKKGIMWISYMIYHDEHSSIHIPKITSKISIVWTIFQLKKIFFCLFNVMVVCIEPLW